MWSPQSANSSTNPSGIWERVQQGNGHLPVNWRGLDFSTVEPKAYYATMWIQRLKLWQERKQRRILLARVQLFFFLQRRKLNCLRALQAIWFYYLAQANTKTHRLKILTHSQHACLGRTDKRSADINLSISQETEMNYDQLYSGFISNDPDWMAQ